MTNELTTVDGAKALAVDPPQRVADLMNLFLNQMDGGGIAELPSPAERRILVDRCHEVHSINAPILESVAARDAARREVAAFLAGWPNLKGDPQQITNAYVAHMSDLPLFAVKLAIRDFRQTSVADWDPKFVPSAPQIYAVAKDHAAKTRAEEHRLRRILTAKLSDGARPNISPEERARVAEAVSAFANGMGEKIKADLAGERAKARMANNAYQASLEPMKRAQYARLGLEPVFGPDDVMLWPNQLSPDQRKKAKTPATDESDTDE